MVMTRKIMNEAFIIGMGSAFDFFPKTRVRKLPFKVSIGDSFASDKAALCKDMENIGGDFWVAISKFTEND